jgi:hypothetical protein
MPVGCQHFHSTRRRTFCVAADEMISPQSARFLIGAPSWQSF